MIETPRGSATCELHRTSSRGTHSATLCNTLQHTATHCATRDMYKEAPGEPHNATHWHRHRNKHGMSLLTCTNTKGNFSCLEKRMRICCGMCATAYNTLEHSTAHCNTLQCVFAMICVQHPITTYLPTYSLQPYTLRTYKQPYTTRLPLHTYTLPNLYQIYIASLQRPLHSKHLRCPYIPTLHTYKPYNLPACLPCL